MMGPTRSYGYWRSVLKYIKPSPHKSQFIPSIHLFLLFHPWMGTKSTVSERGFGSMLCHLSERTSRNDDASYWISIRKGVFLCGRKYCRYRENNQIPFGLKLPLAHQPSNEEGDGHTWGRFAAFVQRSVGPLIFCSVARRPVINFPAPHRSFLHPPARECAAYEL